MERFHFSLFEHRRMPMICRICGDIARGMNFDVLTCMSCKAFFRRNAFKLQKFSVCPRSNNCHINVLTRTSCSACRLRKCYAFGMNPKLIRSFDQTVRQSQSDRNDLPLPQPISLLNNDRSTLNGEEWNLLSNLINVYENENPAQEARSILLKQSAFPVKVRSKPSVVLELIGSFFVSVEPMIRNTLIFRQCPSNLRRLIVKNNCPGIGAFNAMIGGIEIDIYENELHVSICKEIYGARNVEENQRVLQRFDSDRRLLKILLVILAFSSNASIVDFDRQPIEYSSFQTVLLVRAQNILISVFWKYLIHQHGYFRAASRFLGLVKNYLDTMKRMVDHSSDEHRQMVETIVEQIDQKLIFS